MTQPMDSNGLVIALHRPESDRIAVYSTSPDTKYSKIRYKYPILATAIPWYSRRTLTIHTAGEKGFLPSCTSPTTDVEKVCSYSPSTRCFDEVAEFSGEEEFIITRESQIRYVVSVACGVIPKDPCEFADLGKHPLQYHGKLISHTKCDSHIHLLAMMYVQWWRSAYNTSGIDVFSSIVRDLEIRGLRADDNVGGRTLDTESRGRIQILISRLSGTAHDVVQPRSWHKGAVSIKGMASRAIKRRWSSASSGEKIKNLSYQFSSNENSRRETEKHI